jgi:hypothetical protein
MILPPAPTDFIDQLPKTRTQYTYTNNNNNNNKREIIGGSLTLTFAGC